MHPVIKTIRRLREERGLSQENLADEIGIGQSAYSRIERGSNHRISLELLEKIAGSLNVTLAELITGSTPVTNHAIQEPHVNYGKDQKVSEALIRKLEADLEEKNLLITYLKTDVQNLKNAMALSGLTENIEEAVLYKAK